jgi:hypothetical protein
MAVTEPSAESGTPQSVAGSQPSGPSWLRLAGIAGIVHVVVFIGGGVGIASGAPVLSESPDEIREWFADNDAAVSWFTWLGPAVGILLLIFAFGLRRLLVSTDVDRRVGGLWSRLSWTGVVVQFAASLVGLAIWGVLAQEAVIEEISDGTLLAFSAFDSIVFFVCMSWAATLFYGAAAVVIFRSAVLPTWTGALAALAALAAPVGGLWIIVDGDPAGPVANVGGLLALLASMVFVFATSVIMLRRPVEPVI